jgi:hypothetical protein
MFIGVGFEIDISAAAIMKRFEQISDEHLNKLTVFNCFIIIIFLFCLMKNGIFCIESGRKRRNMGAEICSARPRADLYKS